MESRSEKIEKLLIDKNPLSKDDLKSIIGIELFNILIYEGYVNKDWNITMYFDAQIIEKLPYEAKETSYYAHEYTDNTKIYEENYSSGYGRYGWGYHYIIFNGKIHQLLYAWDASC